MRKPGILLGVALIACISAWVLHSEIARRNAAEQRQRSYDEAVVRFKDALPIGISRKDVDEYMKGHDVQYNAVEYGGGTNWTYQLKVGEEPGSLVCNPWVVYVALEFGSADKLTDIHLRKIGTCL